MTARERHSDNPAFLLFKALVTGQKIFYATGDGNVNKKTIVCSELTSISDQCGNQIHVVDPNSSANGQTRDITGVTTGGTVSVGTAFDVQITENTAFILTGIRSTPVEVAAFEAWVKAAIGDASGHALTSLVAKWGDASASLASTILDGIDGRTNTKTLHGLLGVPDDSGKAIYTNIGDFQAQTHLQTLLAALGVPDTSGKPLYTCLVTDRLDHATHGLAAQNTYHWNKDISAYTGVKAGTYLKMLYDDWLNGGRLDLLLDACSTHAPVDVRQSVCLTGDPAGSIGKLLFDNLNAPVGSIPTTPALQATWTDAKAAFLDENISAAKTLTTATIDSIRESVCLTGDTASSIGKILYDVYITRLTAARAGYIDELDFDLDARLDTKAAGRQQIAKTTEDLDQVAGTYDLFTGTTQDVLLESLLIRMPNIVAGGAITSISIQADDTTPQVLISAADGAVANLTAEVQLAWQNYCAPVLIKVGTKIQLTIAGGAHGSSYVCEVIVKVRAITSGGHLT